MILQLKITLADSKPLIWRRLSIPAEYSLHALHHAIQESFNWYNTHLNQFHSSDDEELFSLPEDFRELEFEVFDPLFPAKLKQPVTISQHGTPMIDPRGVSISQVLKNPGDSMNYIYDFAAYWQHSIKVEKILPSGPAIPLLLDGKNNSPPENSGGIEVYQELLKIRAKLAKNHREKDLLEKLFDGDWQNFDPKEFLIETQNRRLTEKFHNALNRAANMGTP